MMLLRLGDEPLVLVAKTGGLRAKLLLLIAARRDLSQHTFYRAPHVQDDDGFALVGHADMVRPPSAAAKGPVMIPVRDDSTNEGRHPR